MTEQTNLARATIQKLLDGAAPNGIAPEMCGAWKTVVRELYEEHTREGTGGVQRLFSSLSAAHPDLARLIAGGETSWSTPLPFAEIDLPTFPLDVFPPWLSDFCIAVTEAMQTPPDLAGMLALSVLSTCCARYVQVEPRDGWREPVNVYTVTSLPPGSRKSPVFRALMNPLITHEQQLVRDSAIARKKAEAAQDVLKQMFEAAKSEAAKAKSDEARARAQDKIDDLSEQLATHVVPAPPKLIVDDVTPESLTSALVEQGGRLACLSAEGDVFGIMAGRYSSGTPNIGIFLKGHAGDTVRLDRRSRSEHVDHPALTIGITTQPNVLREFGTNGAFRGQGLLARFFYALPQSTVGHRRITPPTVPADVEQQYTAHIRALLAYAPIAHSGNSGNTVSRYRSIEGYEESYSGDSVHSVRDDVPASGSYSGDSVDSDLESILQLLSIYLNQESQERFTAFLTWLEPELAEGGAFAGMVDWASKLGGAVLRLAGLLHMAESVCHNCQNRHNSISDDTMVRAIRLAEYLIPHATAAYAEVGTDPHVQEARKIIAWLESTQALHFTKRDAYRALAGSFKRASDLDSPLELLTDRGYIRPVEMEEKSGPGRKPSQQYDVNPHLFTKRSAPTALPTFTA